MKLRDLNEGKTFKSVWLNDEQQRYFKHDEWGNRDKITLTTMSGKYITRTVQHWIITQSGEHRAYITYNSRSFYANVFTVLID
jgi:hypothetical protein